jgi:hypothetical protein
LLSIAAGSGNNTQNFSYAYDSLGDLLERADNVQGLSETFSYDSLNRLTSATVGADRGRAEIGSSRPRFAHPTD